MINSEAKTKRLFFILIKQFNQTRDANLNK